MATLNSSHFLFQFSGNHGTMAPKEAYPVNCRCPIIMQGGGRRNLTVNSLPETAASIVIASLAVGASAVFLTSSKPPEIIETPSALCDACGGSGLCAACRGEGFVLRNATEQNAEKAVSSAKNAATRFTSRLPKKWSYCSRCNSARYCLVCDGRGQLNQ